MEERPPPRTAKIVVIGDSGAGKSSLHQRYMSNSFSREYKCTLGCSYQARTVSVEGVDISLQLWDTAGQERFRSLAASFFRGADGCILACNSTDPRSVQSLARWFKDFCERCPVDEDDRRDFCWAAVECKVDLDSALKAGELDGALGKLLGESGGPATSSAPSSPTNVRRSNGPDAPSYAKAASGKKKADEGPIAHCVNPNQSNQPATDKLEIVPPFSPPSASRHQPSILSFAGTITSSHTTRTDASTSSIYRTPDASMFDRSSVASEETITPGKSSDGEHEHRALHSDEEDEDAYAWQDHEQVLAQLGRESKKHGIDPFMQSSPPRAPATLGSRTTRKVIYSGGPSTVPFDNDVPPPPEPISRRMPTKADLKHDFSQDGIRLFRTSAKTGEGVDELFEYVAKRVLWRWKKDEEREMREMREFGVGSYQEVIRIGQDGKEKGRKGWRAACCA